MSIIYQYEKLDSEQIQKIIGGVMLLSQYSPLHHRYLVAEWYQRIIPALVLNQFCYYEDDDGNPIAFCNWAFLSESTRNELLSGCREISLSDWHSGQHIFIPEMIAPFGHARAVVSDLRRRVFFQYKNQKVCTVRGKLDIQSNRCIRKVQWFSI
ncbi:RTX toxin-activating lysine-acyltransferase RtxC [Providencia rettgeri]|nr:RTX toxin-activating lysine-acyltransferase RtxC [Providencia rettgeri]